MENEQQKDEAREAAREFLLEHIPDQLDFALNPDTREMTHQMMADFALERQQSALRTQWTPIRSEDDLPVPMQTVWVTIQDDPHAKERLSDFVDKAWFYDGVWYSSNYSEKKPLHSALTVIAWRKVEQQPAPYIQHLEQQGGEE